MKKVLILFYILLNFFSCKKEEYSIVNLNGNKITAFGHGGMGFKNMYPVNSCESILKCLNLGMNGTEIDVQMTKDSVLVAFHDKDLSENTTLTGYVNSLNWSELKDAHYTKVPYLSYSIISLEQLFAHIEKLHEYKFIFDCKFFTSTNIHQYNTSYRNAIINVIQKYQLENNIYIESSNEIFLSLFKSSKPDYKFFINPISFQSGLDIASSLKLSGIQMSTHDLTLEQIKIAHANNLWISIWDIHSKSDHNEAIKKNPDFIITDNVENLIKQLK